MSVSVKSGASANLAGVGAEAASGFHTTIKPLHGTHYRIARRFVPAATTLTGVLWVLRNPTASGVLVILKRAYLRVIQVGAPTAAIEDRFSLSVNRAWTVAGTTNSVSIAPAANMQEMRTNMATAVAQVREASAAAGHSGDTRTLDTNPISTGSTWVAAALASGLSNGPIPLFDYYPNVSDGEHPLCLAAEEGIQVSNDNAFGAASGIILQFELYWAEVTAY